MSYRLKMILPLVGMFLLGCVVVVAVRNESRVIKQLLPQSLDDLAAVRLVEIKDASGQTVLNGSFTIAAKKRGNVEGEAALTATGVDADATGKAEIEVSTKKEGSVRKELELKVRNLAPGAKFSLFVDGQQLTVFPTDARGAAALEMTNSPSSW